MKLGLICSIAAGAMLVMAQAAVAQDKMAKPMDMKSMSHTGCLEAGSTSGTYKLSHVEMAMKGGMMKKDGAMPKDGAMAHDTMAKDGMMEMTVMSKSVDLSKHVGHKVTVTGKADKAMMKDSMGKGTHNFTVSSLKMVSATCGM